MLLGRLAQQRTTFLVTVLSATKVATLPLLQRQVSTRRLTINDNSASTGSCSRNAVYIYTALTTTSSHRPNLHHHIPLHWMILRRCFFFFFFFATTIDSLLCDCEVDPAILECCGWAFALC